MKSLDGNEISINHEHILGEMFGYFDVVLYLNKKDDKVYTIKKSDSAIFSISESVKILVSDFKKLIYPDDIKIIEAFNLFSRQRLSSEIRIKDNEGVYRWCFYQLIPVNDHSYFAMYVDLSECQNEGIRLKNQYFKKQTALEHYDHLLNQKYKALINHTDMILFEYDVLSRTVNISTNTQHNMFFISNFNGSFDDFIKTDIIAPDYIPIVQSIMEKLKATSYTSAVLYIKNNVGEYFRCEANFYGVYDNGGSLHSIIGSLKPINDILGKNPMSDSKIGIDYMTGLLNGTSFCAEMKKTIESNPDKNFAVVIFDIERFKSINEVYGVRFGDSAIKYIANTLYEVFDSSNCLTSRFMSDFFGILTPYYDDKSLEESIERLNAKISMYKHVSLRYSYGVYVIKDKSIPARLICDYANMAKNSIKGNHINHIAFYTDGMKDRIIEEINIENDMEKALEDEQFVMYLQPKYHIRDDKVVGAEALARWNHPVKGFIKPAKFIPLFEKNGFIIHLDQYIWEQACRYIKKWCDKGVDPVPISVNVSRVNLKNPKLVDILNGLIEKYNIDKKYLELEITETVYYDDQHALENILEKLKKSGYTLLMDDFGSGFSSLSMLKNTPFDVLKIDRNFLNETMITDRGKKIIQHTICLSNDIGMNTVAEGVETKEQADYLLKCGCCIAQGYYYSKPVPTDEFEKMLGL